MEKFTIFGYTDFIVNNSVYIEIAGNIHYMDDQLDLRTQLYRKVAEKIGIKYIVIRDKDYEQAENKLLFVKEMLLENDIKIN